MVFSKIKAILLFLLILIGLSGCSKEETIDNMVNHTETNRNNLSIIVENNKIEGTLSSGIIVDADINIPDGAELTSMPVYNVTLKEIRFDKFYNIFMKHKKITERMKQKTKDSFGNGRYQSCKAEDGSVLASNGNVYLNFTSAAYQNIQVGFEAEDYKGKQMEKDFSFESSKNAANKIGMVFDELGIEVYPDYECYALNYKWLQDKNKNNNEVLMKNNIAEKKEMYDIKWNKDLDCYLFKYLGAVNGMPITNQIRSIKNNLIPATSIYVVYSKNGIEKFEVSNIFEIDNTEKNKSILSIEEALNKLNQKYNSIILEGKYYVTKILFEYVPVENGRDKKYSLVPAWRFYVSHELNSYDRTGCNKKEKIVIPAQIIFNAVDGSEVLSGVYI